jgi:predicted nucleotidyltransferase
MIRITAFERELTRLLPETERLLRAANLSVHPRVTQVTLHGSRGLRGGFRPDSDIDLSLLVHTRQMPVGPVLDRLLREVVETTLENWESSIEPDVTAVFDVRECGLKCFCVSTFGEPLCTNGGADCFGLYKIQRGFRGFVPPVGLEIRKLYPCLMIWQRPANGDLSAA